MADCVQNCPLTARVDNIESQLDEFQTQNGSSHKDIYNRLGALERSEAVQEVHYAAIMNKLDKDIPAQINGLSAKIDTLERKPAKRWETTIAAVISAVVSGVVMFFLAGGRIG